MANRRFRLGEAIPPLEFSGERGGEMSLGAGGTKDATGPLSRTDAGGDVFEKPGGDLESAAGVASPEFLSAYQISPEEDPSFITPVLQTDGPSRTNIGAGAASHAGFRYPAEFGGHSPPQPSSGKGNS